MKNRKLKNRKYRGLGPALTLVLALGSSLSTYNLKADQVQNTSNGSTPQIRSTPEIRLREIVRLGDPGTTSDAWWNEAEDSVCRGINLQCASLTPLERKLDQNLARSCDAQIRITCRVSHRDAEAYCGKGFNPPLPNSRLPTARELAQIAHPQGIAETNHPGIPASNSRVQMEIEQMKRLKFDAIFIKDSTGQPVVDFYFKNGDPAYRRPKDAVTLWSSTVFPYYDDTHAYTMNFYYGSLQEGPRNVSLGYIRCVKNPHEE